MPYWRRKVKINLDMSEINYDINYNAWELDNEYFVHSFCEWKTFLKKFFQEN